jgi:hypothetical protein
LVKKHKKKTRNNSITCFEGTLSTGIITTQKSSVPNIKYLNNSSSYCNLTQIPQHKVRVHKHMQQPNSIVYPKLIQYNKYSEYIKLNDIFANKANQCKCKYKLKNRNRNNSERSSYVSNLNKKLSKASLTDEKMEEEILRSMGKNFYDDRVPMKPLNDHLLQDRTANIKKIVRFWKGVCNYAIPHLFIEHMQIIEKDDSK